jgi:peroxiredoxin
MWHGRALSQDQATAVEVVRLACLCCTQQVRVARRELNMGLSACDRTFARRGFSPCIDLDRPMSASTIIAWALLGLLLLFLGFLLLGALRTLTLLAWRLDQLEATTPGRLNRNGLARGVIAPEFTLPALNGNPLTFDRQTGNSVLLVFVQTHCHPCHEIVLELNNLQRRRRDLQVLAVLHARPEEVPDWVAESRPEFPVALQEDRSVSKRYEVFATPFAFLIDERGVILSKGIVMSRQHIGLLLSTAERPSSMTAAPHDDMPARAHSASLQAS